MGPSLGEKLRCGGEVDALLIMFGDFWLLDLSEGWLLLWLLRYGLFCDRVCMLTSESLRLCPLQLVSWSLCTALFGNQYRISWSLYLGLWLIQYYASFCVTQSWLRCLWCLKWLHLAEAIHIRNTLLRCMRRLRLRYCLQTHLFLMAGLVLIQYVLHSHYKGFTVDLNVALINTEIMRLLEPLEILLFLGLLQLERSSSASCTMLSFLMIKPNFRKACRTWCHVIVIFLYVV